MFSYFENLLNPYPETEPVEPPDNLFAFCVHFCRGAWPWLFAMSFLSAAIAVTEVALFSFLGELVEALSVADRTTFMAEWMPRLGWMLVVVLIIYPIIAVLQTLIVHQTLLGNLPMIFRWQAHRYLLRHGLNFFNNEFAGRIGTKVMQTSLAVRETVMKLLDILVYVGVYFVSVVVLVASSDIRLIIPLMIWFAGYMLTLRIFIPRLRLVSQAQADARSHMTGRIIDSYTNIGTVKLFSHAGNEASYAKEGMDNFLVTVHKQMRLSTGFQLCVDNSTMLLLAATTAMSIYLWLENAIGVGAIAIAVGVTLRLHGMAHWIMWEMSALFENIGIVHDGMATLSRERDVQDIEGAQPFGRVTGKIEFKDVAFHYGKDTSVIEKLNLSIQPGEKVGLVGPSGAGKTTLVNILLRLYDIQSGQVLIDGTNIREVTQDSLRENIGVVTQDTSLLHRSVRDNIAYGSDNASLEDIIIAAKRANAYDFIQDLEDIKGRTGFEAHVGERGITLSGGQRQRIAIARVFLKDAPVLVLDEATSALDSEVEAAIQENLLELMEGKTVIAIAHRLSTIATLDRLLVMEEGSVVEQGTHEQLRNSGGLYSRLWKRQSGGFI